MPDKPRKTAAELKLMIEEKLRAGHPESSVAVGSKASLNSFANSSI
jgi:hypothetical protein